MTIEAYETEARINRQIGRLMTFLRHATEEDYWQVPEVKRSIKKLKAQLA
jgi:hypothetical protein